MTDQITSPQIEAPSQRQPRAKTNTNFLANIFEFASEVINSAERSFLDLLLESPNYIQTVQNAIGRNLNITI